MMGIVKPNLLKNIKSILNLSQHRRKGVYLPRTDAEALVGDVFPTLPLEYRQRLIRNVNVDDVYMTWNNAIGYIPQLMNDCKYDLTGCLTTEWVLWYDDGRIDILTNTDLAKFDSPYTPSDNVIRVARLLFGAYDDTSGEYGVKWLLYKRSVL